MSFFWRLVCKKWLLLNLEVQSQSLVYPIGSLAYEKVFSGWGNLFPGKRETKKKIFLFSCSRKTEAPLNEKATCIPQ